VVIVNEPAPEPPLLDEELLDEALLLPPEDDELPLELLEDDEPPLLEAELLLAPLEDELLPLEDELLLELEDELELELELVAAPLPALLSSWPHAAMARHEIAASTLSSSVEWRMRSVRFRRATSGHDSYSAKMTRKKMSRSRDGVFGTSVTLFAAMRGCRRGRRDPDV